MRMKGNVCKIFYIIFRKLHKRVLCETLLSLTSFEKTEGMIAQNTKTVFFGRGEYVEIEMLYENNKNIV